MRSVQETYLGWQRVIHREGCKRPVWEVDVRRRDNVARYHGHGEPPLKHSCPDEYCHDHGNTFTEVTVRIVCRSCGAAEVVMGEHTQDTGHTITSTALLGYGLPPRKAAGLWLWPGDPWLNVFREETGEPFDFLVTAERVDRVTKADVVGQITQGRGKRGAVMWAANAVQAPDGPYGTGLGRINWAAAQDGFKTVAAAAKWVSAELAAERGTGGGL